MAGTLKCGDDRLVTDLLRADDMARALMTKGPDWMWLRSRLLRITIDLEEGVIEICQQHGFSADRMVPATDLSARPRRRVGNQEGEISSSLIDSNQ